MKKRRQKHRQKRKKHVEQPQLKPHASPAPKTSQSIAPPAQPVPLPSPSPLHRQFATSAPVQKPRPPTTSTPEQENAHVSRVSPQPTAPARKPLTLSRKVDAGHIRQSFSHGKSKSVVVERKKINNERERTWRAAQFDAGLVPPASARRHPEWHVERARSVAKSSVNAFSDLLQDCGVNPYRQLTCANLSGIDFAGSDLRFYDFRGSLMIGCRFAAAKIEGAAFEGCDLRETDIETADDWDSYWGSWQKPSMPVSTAHLRPGAVISDAPFAPTMVVIPAGKHDMGIPGGSDCISVEMLGGAPQFSERPVLWQPVEFAERFAVSQWPVTRRQWAYFEWDSTTREDPRRAGFINGPSDNKSDQPRNAVNWNSASAYVMWLSDSTGCEYRLLSDAEWEYCCGLAAKCGLSNFGRDAEWCADDERDCAIDLPVSDGSAWIDEVAHRKVVRGGNWGRSSLGASARVRGALAPDVETSHVVLRIARELAKSDQIGHRQMQGVLQAVSE